MCKSSKQQTLGKAKVFIYGEKFSKNDYFSEDYISFMKDIIAKVYARKSTTEATSGKTWYLPHYGVYHPNKPGKIRVVFDLSADYKGRCLNRELLSGPDLTNQIVGVLLRFREEQIAVMGDIEAMFHQVKVPKDQCSFLKFLWWDNSNPDKEIIDYEMTAHVFGGTSSPSCSNFALRRTAKDNEQQYGKEITQILERSFYVDDLLKSFPTVNQAVNAIKQLQELCSRGGFNLTTFISNKQEVIKSIPDDKRKPNVRNELVTLGNLPEERALGVKWDTQNDTLGFYIKLADKPLTRRGLLSTLSSVYDPLGLGAPFLLKGKQIIQQLCRKRLNWDAPIDERSSYEWQKWKNNLSIVEDIKLPRCYRPRGFERIINYSLHHFSDASECGYGQATYLRMVNDLEEVHCSLIFGKSRVAPVKYVSIPRLELTAATLSVKISKMLREGLDIHISSEVFCTDSKVALGYINNDSRRFKIFVANRVQFIRDNTNIGQ